MADVVVIRTVDELRKFLNEKGLMEIVLRAKNQKFKTFIKVALDQPQESEAKKQIKKVMNLLNENNNLSLKNLNLLNNISKLNKLNLVLNGLNLCSTWVGFAIMYEKLDRMSAQIADVVNVYKEANKIRIDFEFRKILSEHSNMLDCRKKQNYYTEEQMRELVDGEYNVLELLIDIFLSDISNDRDNLLFSILSLASMLSVSIIYFDEIYYFQNKEAIGDGNQWHMAHDKWVAIFDKLSSSKFIDTIQDCGLFKMGLNTIENDCFYISFYDRIRELKQDIEDNQFMIKEIDDKELFDIVVKKSSEEFQNEIEDILEKAGVTVGTYDDAIRVAVA